METPGAAVCHPLPFFEATVNHSSEEKKKSYYTNTHSNNNTQQRFNKLDSMGLSDVVQQRIVKPFAALSYQERLFCAFVGLLGGCFPVPALTTIVTAFLCRLLRLSAPQVAAAMVVNLLSTPLELLLIPYLARATAWVLQTDASTFTAEFLAQSLQHGGVWQLLEVASSMLLHAVIGWIVLTALMVAAAALTVRKPPRGSEQREKGRSD